MSALTGIMPFRVSGKCPSGTPSPDDAAASPVAPDCSRFFTPTAYNTFFVVIAALVILMLFLWLVQRLALVRKRRLLIRLMHKHDELSPRDAFESIAASLRIPFPSLWNAHQRAVAETGASRGELCSQLGASNTWSMESCSCTNSSSSGNSKSSTTKCQPSTWVASSDETLSTKMPSLYRSSSCSRCIICFVSIITDPVELLPCGHANMCARCVLQLWHFSTNSISCVHCPLCRAAVTFICPIFDIRDRGRAAPNSLRVLRGRRCSRGASARTDETRSPRSRYRVARNRAREQDAEEHQDESEESTPSNMETNDTTADVYRHSSGDSERNGSGTNYHDSVIRTSTHRHTRSPPPHHRQASGNVVEDGISAQEVDEDNHAARSGYLRAGIAEHLVISHAPRHIIPSSSLFSTDDAVGGAGRDSDEPDAQVGEDDETNSADAEDDDEEDESLELLLQTADEQELQMMQRPTATHRPTRARAEYDDDDVVMLMHNYNMKFMNEGSRKAWHERCVLFLHFLMNARYLPAIVAIRISLLHLTMFAYLVLPADVLPESYGFSYRVNHYTSNVTSQCQLAHTDAGATVCSNSSDVSTVSRTMASAFVFVQHVMKMTVRGRFLQSLGAVVEILMNCTDEIFIAVFGIVLIGDLLHRLLFCNM